MQAAVLVSGFVTRENAVFYVLQVSEIRRNARWNVEKRFSHFATLRLALKEAYPDIPPLPPKTMLRTSDEAYLRYRQEQLQSFLSVLLGRQDLSRSAALASFLAYEENASPLPKANEILSQSLGQPIKKGLLFEDLLVFTTQEHASLGRFQAYFSSWKVPFRSRKQAIVGSTEVHRREGDSLVLKWRTDHESLPTALAYSPQLGLVLVGFSSGQIHCYFINSEEVKMQFSAHKGPVRGLLLTADSAQAVSVGEDKRMVVTDLHNHRELFDCVLPDKPVQAEWWGQTWVGLFTHILCGFAYQEVGTMLTFALNQPSLTLTCMLIWGNWAFVGTQAGLTLTYSLDKKQEGMHFLGIGAVTAIACSDTRKEVIVGNDKGNVTIFSLNSGELTHVISGFESNVTFLAWDEASQRLFLSGYSRQLRLLQLPPSWTALPSDTSDPLTRTEAHSVASLSGWDHSV